eukprot:Skav232920  [mRNA]  locus=scaffold1477:793829:799428:- [translate_table: standard]
MVLADSIVPVLRCRGELTVPIVMYKQKAPAIGEPNLLTLHLPDSALEVHLGCSGHRGWLLRRQSLNPNSGMWEPILERFRALTNGLALDMERKVYENDRDLHVHIRGHEPMLLNVTPSTVKRLKYIMPLFIESVTSSSLVGEHNGDADAAQAAVKYRVVNLSGCAMDLHFRSRYKQHLIASVKPSGSRWTSLDEWILPHFASAVTAQVGNGTRVERWSKMGSVLGDG